MELNQLFDLSSEILPRLCSRGNSGVGGALLVSGSTPNIMTIGWGMVGTMWNQPVLIVPVRDSRYSLETMNACPEFTVNLFADNEDPRAIQLLKLCGKASGRDSNKFETGDIATLPARTVKVPTLAECAYVVECQTVYQQRMDPGALLPALEAAAYGGKDYHTFFYGKVLDIYRR